MDNTILEGQITITDWMPNAFDDKINIEDVKQSYDSRKNEENT